MKNNNLFMSSDDLDYIAFEKDRQSSKPIAFGLISLIVAIVALFIASSNYREDGASSGLSIVNLCMSTSGFLVFTIGIVISIRSFWVAAYKPISFPIWTSAQKKLLGISGMNTGDEFNRLSKQVLSNTSRTDLPAKEEFVNSSIDSNRRTASPYTSPFITPERKYRSPYQTPSPSGRENIRTEAQLDKYLENHEKIQCRRKRESKEEEGLGVTGWNSFAYQSSTVFTSPTSSFQSPQLYAVPPRPSSVRKSVVSGESGSEFTAIDVEEATRLLNELGLTTTFHDLADNVRRLVARHLQDFVAAFGQNEDELVQCGVLRDVLEREILVQPIFTPPGQSFSRSNLSLADILLHFSEEPLFQSRLRPGINLIQEHKSYEKYIDVEGHSKAYVLNRMRTLAEDGYLGQMRWDGGGSWKGREWTNDLPNDAQIIMNTFCALLDGMLPPSYDGDRPFKRAHFISSVPSSKGTSIRGRFVIYMSQVSPPHFKVISNGKTREVLPGKKNSFFAIVLFLHAIKQQKSGHLGNINLHTILEQVFDTA